MGKIIDLLNMTKFISIVRYLKMRFYYNFILKNCGKGSLIIKPILLSKKCISLGDCVFIRNNARIEGVFSFQDQLFTPSIIIEDNVNIEQNVHITCTNSISIGTNSSIAANVTISDTIHSHENIDIYPRNQLLLSKKVKIGSKCTIYNNSVILPGTELGDNVIVGANSVVGGIFPSFTIIGGIPAKILKKYNFNTLKWEDIR